MKEELHEVKRIMDSLARRLEEITKRYELSVQERMSSLMIARAALRTLHNQELGGRPPAIPSSPANSAAVDPTRKGGGGELPERWALRLEQISGENEPGAGLMFTAADAIQAHGLGVALARPLREPKEACRAISDRDTR